MRAAFFIMSRSIRSYLFSRRRRAAFEKMRINLPGTNSSPQALPVDAPLSRAVVVEDGHDVTCALVNDQDHIFDAIHCTSKILPNV